MSLVLDASAALAWIFPEETTPAIELVFAKIAEEGAWAPPLWRLEMANILTMGMRRGRIRPALRQQSLADLALLPIFFDPDGDKNAWGDTLTLADRHELSVYDATYLELALRRRLPLATLDRALRRAAMAESLPLLGLD